MWCVIGSPFENVVHVLKWNQSKEKVRVSSLSKSRDLSPDASLAGGMSGDRSVGSPLSRASSVQKQTDLSVLSKYVTFLDMAIATLISHIFGICSDTQYLMFFKMLFRHVLRIEKSGL